MAYAESWHVRSRSRECSRTQRPFIDGETIVTALYPDPESSGYIRRDISLDSWNPQDEGVEKPFSFWKTRFSAPAGNENADSVQKLSPEEILCRLVEEDQDHTENTRYILAVMLERRRILRETDSQPTPNGILRVYEHRKSGEVFLIRDPNIPLAEVESLQKEVFDLLENNGRLPEPADPDPDPAGVRQVEPDEAAGESEPEATVELGTSAEQAAQSEGSVPSDEQSG